MVFSYNLLKRQFLIHKKSQLSLAFYFLFLHLVVISVICFFLHGTIKSSLAEYGNVTGTVGQMGILSDQLSHDVKVIFILFTVISSPILFYSVVVFTNRLVGPLSRYQNILKSLKNGESVAIQGTRKHDFFSEFYQDLKEYINKHEQK